MKCRMSKETIIGPGVCDHSSRLGIPDTFSIFMDLAAEHAESLGIGTTFMMKEKKFWLTAKTRVSFIRRPDLMEKVVLNTWPLSPRGIQEIRDYSITDTDGNVLALGKTQWAVLDMKTGSLIKIEDIFDEEWELDDFAVLSEPFARINDDISYYEEAGKYEIRSIDIDLGGHMNNAAYVRALFSIFTTGELDKMNISDCEICYKNSCYEGDVLTFYKKDNEGCIDIVALNREGKTAILARLK